MFAEVMVTPAGILLRSNLAHPRLAPTLLFSVIMLPSFFVPALFTEPVLKEPADPLAAMDMVCPRSKSIELKNRKQQNKHNIYLLIYAN